MGHFLHKNIRFTFLLNGNMAANFKYFIIILCMQYYGVCVCAKHRDIELEKYRYTEKQQ